MSDDFHTFEFDNRPAAHVKIAVDDIEKMSDGTLHLMSPSGQLAGVLRHTRVDGHTLSLPVEDAHDEIRIQVGRDEVIDMLTDVALEEESVGDSE